MSKTDVTSKTVTHSVREGDSEAARLPSKATGAARHPAHAIRHTPSGTGVAEAETCGRAGDFCCRGKTHVAGVWPTQGVVEGHGGEERGRAWWSLCFWFVLRAVKGFAFMEAFFTLLLSV